MKKNKVLLGMSGGVDSSMSAYYLLEQGYEVIGITFNTVTPLSSPDSRQFIAEAKKLAERLNFEHHVIDVYDDFKKEVIDYFVDEYLHGRTPNPCIRCNETIKWKLLFEHAERLDCAKISTGHYVNVIEKEGFYYIEKGIDPAKDQSYFLWNLPQTILAKCLFPLGKMIKVDVKTKALNLGFNTMASKKESMGVCFLHGQDYRDFINTIKPQLKQELSKGDIINKQGEKIGTHDGFPYYTIGQKRGLNLQKNQGEYVACIDSKNNRLITAPKNTLFSSSVVLREYISCNPEYINKPQQVDIRIRGLDAVPPTPGTIKLLNGNLHVEFSNPVWALTPGQSIVFYEKNIVVGGGIVDDISFNSPIQS